MSWCAGIDQGIILDDKTKMTMAPQDCFCTEDVLSATFLTVRDDQWQATSILKFKKPCKSPQDSALWPRTFQLAPRQTNDSVLVS
jgi:hypothetical protein